MRRLIPAIFLAGMMLLPAGLPAATDAFKITFGRKTHYHGRSWSGGIRDARQVRRIIGWHLGVEDKILPPNRWHIVLRIAGGLIAPKAVVVELTSPEDQPVPFYSRYGDFSFVPAKIPYGEVRDVDGLGGDVTVERVPAPVTLSRTDHENDDPALLRTRTGEYWMAWVGYRTIRREGYRIEGGDEVLVAESTEGRNWSAPRAITPPGDHFHVALGEDTRGRVWCVYGEQKEIGGGNFDLYARFREGSNWSDEQRLTSSRYPDIFHRMAGDRTGRLFLVWMGYRQRPSDTLPQSEVLLRVLTKNGWSEESNLSQSAADDWAPTVAAGQDGRAWIVWDSYRSKGGTPPDFDVMIRPIERKGESYVPGRVRAIAASPRAEMNPDVAVDRVGRVWVAWEEGSANWGKDSGYRNPRHGIFLRPGGAEIYRPPDRKTGFARRPRIAVMEGGRWQQTAAELTAGLAGQLSPRLLQNPHLAVDAGGNLRVIIRHQLTPRGRNGGHLFDLYITSLAGAPGAQSWRPPVLLPLSTGRQDTLVTTAPDADAGLVIGVVGDGRRLPVGLPEHHAISVLHLPGVTVPVSIDTAKLEFGSASGFVPTHPREMGEVARVRRYRIHTSAGTYKIVRGDLHRHTEISMDGATDGTLWDLYRYALDAAAFDYIAVTDHNYGAWLDTDEPESPNTDSVYQWWRTQKSADLFYVPGRFVPLYGYERSVNFPLGHVNIFHPRRGVFSYRVPKLHIAERPEIIESDARGLVRYLKATGGVGVAHTSGTIMGTDWRYHNDSLVPVVEIYQGDRNSYEEEGAPRAALPNATGPGWAGRAPFQKGLVRNALGAGFHLGFIASSDHYSTHISYANLIVPDRPTNREDIQAAILGRHTYASTDNIVLEFRAGEALQGSRIAADESPRFHVRVVGTEPVLRVDVVKNNKVFYTYRPEKSSTNGNRVSFTFRDTAAFGGDFNNTTMGPTSQISDWSHPETGVRPRPVANESYYYVRVLQSFSEKEPAKPGEMAWSSPIYVRR